MNKPLVLLDVDGVINDIDLVAHYVGGWDVDIIESHGYSLIIPAYMPALIRDICRVAEVHWCTTWRERANHELAAHLGIDALPVVTDGTRDCYTGWKPAAAHGVAAEALAAGRRVLWIEDFYGEVPTRAMPVGTEFLDTTSNSPGALLLPENLPAWLYELMGQDDGVAA